MTSEGVDKLNKRVKYCT